MRDSAFELLIAVHEGERVRPFAFELPLPSTVRSTTSVGPGEEAGH